ncbi:hypothetical protein HCG51_22240 [Tolypothrix sp. PCC 7910]|uniref:hypothetical protein n=1 Tax=Tolypothrix sp. PCC 7910 TaxID=2099387 RepID=UPI0014277B51|nr:hypothetical protein [Tolypothrix sp. PCC 7910]QIR39159.1 hypothetical protein HCG51_22240 [Tolypothrix sp. PCC 7910]
MQSKGWKNFLFALFLTIGGANWYCIRVDKVWAASSQRDLASGLSLPKTVALNVTSLAIAQIATEGCEQPQANTNNYQLPELANIHNIHKVPKSAHRIFFSQPIDILSFNQGDSCLKKFLKSANSLQSSLLDAAVEAGKPNFNCQDNLCKQPSNLKILYSQRIPDSSKPGQATAQVNPEAPNTSTPEAPANPANVGQPNNPPPNNPPANDPPPLEVQPNTVPSPSPSQIEQLLETPQPNYSQRLERLRQRLQQQTQSPSETNNLELGLRVKPRTIVEAPPLEQQPPTPIETPVPQFQPIGTLEGRVGFFHSDNIFSSNVDPIQDSLIFYGLTLASAYFPLSSKTYISGSIDGTQIHYLNQSLYDYNQLRFNVSLYRQLSRRMYGELAWSNQMLFYANNSDTFKSGDRFLSENSIRLSVGRRDPLSSKLFLDSFYGLSVSFADPESRSRIINSLWLSLSYYVQKPLQVGINYQFNLSNFTNRPDAREDEFHRLFGHLTYRVSRNSNLNLQTGVSFGGSSAPNIDFNGWFFSLNYNLELGQF